MTVLAVDGALERALEPEPYDFRRPVALAREQARTLQFALETFARQWGTQLTSKLRLVTRVELGGVAVRSYDAFVSPLDERRALVLCAIPNLEARAVMEFGVEDALRWIARMLGGSTLQDPPKRPFTLVEQAFVRRLVTDAVEDLRYSLGGLLPVTLEVDSIHTNPQFAQAAATTEDMVVATFTISVGEQQSEASIAIPAAVVLPQLGDHTAPASAADPAEVLRAQLVSVPVDVALALRPADVRAATVLSLAVGDILPLPHPQHRPLDLVVEGQVVAHAAIGAQGSRLACVVVDLEETA